jgi:hypothetical protein
VSETARSAGPFRSSCTALAWLTVASVVACGLHAAEPLRVSTDFEGGSAEVLGVDDATRSIRIMPGGTASRGWPCWWSLRIDGLDPGQPVTLLVRGSTATRPATGTPLSASWALPDHAAWSTDGTTWAQTEKGVRDGVGMTYRLVPPGRSLFVAWGPPFTPSAAAAFVADLAGRSSRARAETLCRSREGRAVPMLHIREGDRADADRFGIWVQARQHAWESGSSWVARGFAEWCVSDADEARWLRHHADIFIVPIMDVDNTATGNGGKEAEPWDHNRDWSDQPHWPETAAAQRRVATLIEQGRMDVFLDLHNPAPGDPTFFYVLDPGLLPAASVTLRDQFVAAAYARITAVKPMIPMSNRPKTTGPQYHPRWRQISSNWVALRGNPQTVSVCLETIWNSPASTTAGYRSVGAALAAATRDHLVPRPGKADR